MKPISLKIYTFRLFQNIFGYFSNTFLLIGMMAYISFWFVENGDTGEIGSEIEKIVLVKIGVIFFGTIIIVKILNFFNQIFAFVYHKIYLEDILNRNNSIIHAFKIVFKLYWSFLKLNLYKYKLKNIDFYIDKYQGGKIKEFFKKGGGYIAKYLPNLIETKALLEEKKSDNYSLDNLFDFLFSKSNLLLQSLYLERYSLIRHKKFYFLNPIIFTPFTFLLFSFLNIPLNFPIFMLIFTFGFTVGFIFNNRSDVDIDYYGNLFYLKLLGYQCPQFEQIFNEARNHIENINNNLAMENSATNLTSEVKNLRNKYFKIIAFVFVSFFLGSIALVYLMNNKIISQFTMITLFFSIFSFITFFGLSKLNNKNYMIELYSMGSFFKKDEFFSEKEKNYIKEVRNIT